MKESEERKEEKDVLQRKCSMHNQILFVIVPTASGAEEKKLLQ